MTHTFHGVWKQSTWWLHFSHGKLNFSLWKKKCLVFEVICLSSHSHLIKKNKIKKLGINNSRTIQENSKHFTFEVSKVTIYQNLKWWGSIALQTEVNKLPEKTRSTVQTCISMVRIRVCKKNNPLFPFLSEPLPPPYNSKTFTKLY